MFLLIKFDFENNDKKLNTDRLGDTCCCVQSINILQKLFPNGIHFTVKMKVPILQLLNQRE